MKVTINNWQDAVEITEAMSSLLEGLACNILCSEGCSDAGEVSVNLVDNERIRELNRSFCGKDRPTDVLAFNLDDERDGELEEGSGERMLGDVVISAEKAAEQAKEYGGSFTRELALLTAHGVLHLLGYDHEEEGEERIMGEKQEQAVQELGL